MRILYKRVNDSKRLLVLGEFANNGANMMNHL